MLAGFAASVWLATATHYYGGLLLVPFAVGQAVADRNRSSRDRSIWTILAVAPLAVVPWVSLLQPGLAAQSGFWLPLHPVQILCFYANMLAPVAIAIVVSLVAAGLVGYFLPAGADQHRTRLRSHEVAFAGALAFLPAVGWSAAFFVTGAWTDRYAISAVLGLGILIAAALDRAGPFTVQVVCAVAVITLLVREARPMLSLFRPVTYPQLILADDDGTSPVVVSNALTYLQLWHYASPAMRARLTY